MEGISIEGFRVLLERAGLQLPPEEMESLKPQFERHLQLLEVLYAADLAEEEVAEVFLPRWGAPGEVPL